MKDFIVYNLVGEILRTGSCQDGDFGLQIRDPGESVMEGKANDKLQKIVDGRVVDKLPGDIEPEPEPLPYGQQSALITNKQWQEVLDRLDQLEKE